MAIKKNQTGKVIAQVQDLKIRQINKTHQKAGKTFTQSTQISIFRGAQVLEAGFKNRESALIRAQQIKAQ